MNLILVGPQGSGKGTQAELLNEEFNIPTFSVGQALRSQINQNTEFGQSVKQYVESGELVPNDLTNKIIAEEIKKEDYTNGILLDGYPRDLEQVKFLESHINIDYLILIEISQDETIKRLSGRRVCECGENYHIEYKKPKNDMVCDLDNKPLKQRKDDNPEAIKERLNIYHTQTEPVVDYYDKKGKVIKINGEASIEEVYKRIKEALKERGMK